MSQEQATQQYKSAQAHLESEQRARNQALARQQRQITELQQHLDTMRYVLHPGTMSWQEQWTLHQQLPQAVMRDTYLEMPAA